MLWTRLAPEPLRGGGMPAQPVTVTWEVAEDEAMRRVVRQGTETATPELAHSVHAEVAGLEPGRTYWYRFTVGDAQSPIGRTRTAPPLGAATSRLRFALASCQHWQHGYFTPYRHMAADDLDVVVHVGDYIYESRADPAALRQHDGLEPRTLTDYRNRHALYKTDPDLQAAHATFPWIVTWDDHEVSNNYAGDGPSSGDRSVFQLRRAAAYQAYYEHQPLRRAAAPRGREVLLYRSVAYGNLALFHVLDTRQYRAGVTTCQPADLKDGYCPVALDPRHTMLGAAQRDWLMDGMDRSAARWNVLAQQVVFSPHDGDTGPGRRFGTDGWDGYAAERSALLEFLAQRRPSNPVVLTGDVHQNRVYDVVANPDDPSAPLAAEFVGTSISTNGDSAPNTVHSLPDNPHLRLRNANRGYVRCEVTPERWQTDFRIVSTVRQRDATISTLASFVVEDGKPGVQRA